MFAKLEFFGNLKDFLKVTPNFVNLKDHPQLKDAIESCRVPHCEVGEARVNGRPALITTLLKDQDSVKVFPIANPQVANKKFLVDCNLGKLNSLLRSLGFDSFYENDISDEKILEVAGRENRTVLTKDRRLLMRKNLRDGYFVRSIFPKDQITEVLKRFSLFSDVKLLSRCIDCNTETVKVAKEKIISRLEPLTKKYYDDFNQCPNCRKIFWRGTHFDKIKSWADNLVSTA